MQKVMESSPPSFPAQTEASLLSEDSGLLITSGPFSSDAVSGVHHDASKESDINEKSLSLGESAGASECMGGDYITTVKKSPAKATFNITQPPPEFQDNPVQINKDTSSAAFETPTVLCVNESTDKSNLSSLDIPISTMDVSPMSPTKPEQTDDSSIDTQANPSDTLPTKMSDIIKAFDGEGAYSIDLCVPSYNYMRNKGKRPARYNKREKDAPLSVETSIDPPEITYKSKDTIRRKDAKTRRHSSSAKNNASDSDPESSQLTLAEINKFLETVYTGASDAEYMKAADKRRHERLSKAGVASRHAKDSNATVLLKEDNIKANKGNKNKSSRNYKTKKSRAHRFSTNVKQSFCNLLCWRRRLPTPSTTSSESDFDEDSADSFF